MHANSLKKGSTIKINNISELGSTAVNVAFSLYNLQKKEIKLDIIEYGVTIDLSDNIDTLRICTRLLIDKEFSPKFDLKTEPDVEKKVVLHKSRLDIHAKEIIEKINSRITYTQIEKDYHVSKTCLKHWRRTRTYVTKKGIVKLKQDS